MEKLNALRAGNRAAITKTLKKLKEIISMEATDYETEIVDELYGTLIKKRERVNKLNEDILEKTEAEQTEQEFLEQDEYETELNIEIKRLEKIMKDKALSVQTENVHNQIQQPMSVHHSLSSFNPNAHEFMANVSPNVSNFTSLQQLSGLSNPSYGSSGSVSHKLPKLVLPKFSGDILQWQSFWDAFDCAVNGNVSLNNVQKFTYLKSLLHGEALETITGFALTNANYQEAITLLRNRYGQEHKVCQRYMQALLEIPPAENSLRSLRQFYDKFEIYIRGLDSLGQSEETFGALLVPIILNKLDSEIRRNIAREHKCTKWSLTELRKCILSEINVMEAGLTIDSLHLDSSHDFPVESTAAFFTNAKSKVNNPVNVAKNTVFTATKDTIKPLIANQKDRVSYVKGVTIQVYAIQLRKVIPTKKESVNTAILQNENTATFQSDNIATSSVTRNNDDDTAAPISSLHSSLSQARKNVLLKTAIAPVHGDSISVNANILLDEGAMRSFITESLAEKLKLKTQRTETVQLCGFGAKENTVKNISTAVIKLKTLDDQFIPMEVLVVPEISVPIKTHQNVAAGMTHLSGLQLAHPVDSQETFEISFLIGADYYWEVVLDKIIRGDGPTAVSSKIGYLLSGSVNKEHNSSSNVSMMNVMIAHKAEETNLEKFWEIETSGIKDQNKQNCETLNNYTETCINFDGNRYVAKLPWIEDHGPLPDNKSVAFSRTKNVVKRLKREPQLLRLYGDIIKDQEIRGFIERVEDGNYPENGKLHYIPHHPVAKDSATTPIRIVFDCSCRASSDLHNLNDCLQKTPPQLNDLSSILLRFRQRQHAVTADIEKAFLNIGLHTEDRDVTRFFWLKDPSDPNSPFITYRFRSVLFGATCSPFILSATLLKHLGQHQNFVGKHLRENLYVDNVVTSFDNKDDLLKFYTESRSLLSAANFNLRSWASNCCDLVSQATEDNVKDSDELVKVLGMRWNVKRDTLTYAKQEFDTENGLITKREVLRQISKIYDPMEIISPVTVRSKMFMQSLWKQQLEWDQILSDGDQKEWFTIKRDLEEVVETEVERFYFRENENNDIASLHVFTDASERAYGACAYIVSGSKSTLVVAKNRVSPIKQTLTIPKLELMGALMGAKLAHHLQTTLNCSNISMWCDSQIVLKWLSSTKPLPRFVENRVKTIKELIPTSDWRYCPTGSNPADLLSRGMSAEKFKHSTLWKEGPSWITRKNDWPTWMNENSLKDDRYGIDDGLVQNHCYIVDSEANNQGIQNIVDISKTSSYKKLLRITAYVVRLIKNCRKRKTFTGAVSTEEISSAAQLWIKGVQEQEYNKEISAIKQGKMRSSSIVQQLQLYLDDHGVLRSKGRIHNAPLSSSAKFPMLLPPKHELTRLIVMDAHTKLCHSGVNSTVTLLRQVFWIPSVRQRVKSIIHKCVTCRRTTGKPYTTPIPPPLPKDRLLQEPPFTVCGVDFTGHLYVKCERNLRKVYLCLFTCASTRAVHLEVMRDLSEKTFLLAFRRFCSRKSLPRIMISDNGTTFVAAAKEIERLSKSRTLQEKLIHEGTSWKFIPKRAPWYGGWWERIIGVMKNCLRKTLGKSLVSMDTLQTIIVEVERILNDRPLTYVSSDPTDDEPLTPSHLLYGRKVTNLPYPFDENILTEKLTNGTASKIYNSVVEILSHFWERWKHEYLTSLREYQRNSGVNEQKIQTGDVVLVHNDFPRSKWPLAIVEELSTGGDGMVRSATIRTKHGVTTRPISKLFPLELNVDEDIEISEDRSKDNIPPSATNQRSRITKTLARERIKQWTK